jgi:O-antigen ligase
LPTAVNNFLPSVWLGDPGELGASEVPLISFLDILALIGILKYGLSYNEIRLPKFSLIITAIILLFIVNNSINRTPEYFTTSVYGLWQIRYLFYSIVIVSGYSSRTIRHIMPIALLVGISALVIEALIFTVVNGSSYLTSGSLGTNSFGNLVGALALYFILHGYLKKSGTYSRLLYAFAITLLYCSYETGTRMSIIAFAMSLITLYLIRARKRAILVSIITLPLIYTAAPEEYRFLHLLNIDDIVNALKYGFDFDGTSAILNDDNSSILARLNLWRTSGEMIIRNPFNGIGAGTWNLLKTDYGFRQHVLIDSHNGYLSFLAEYGLIVGGYLIWFIYRELLSIRMHIRGREAGIGILLYYAISEFSNSGTLRPQVFALILLVVSLLNKNKIESYDRL